MAEIRVENLPEGEMNAVAQRENAVARDRRGRLVFFRGRRWKQQGSSRVDLHQHLAPALEQVGQQSRTELREAADRRADDDEAAVRDQAEADDFTRWQGKQCRGCGRRRL